MEKDRKSAEREKLREDTAQIGEVVPVKQIAEFLWGDADDYADDMAVLRAQRGRKIGLEWKR